jgi:hypothetical protein
MPRRALWSSWTQLFDFVQDPESIDGTASWGCSPAIGCFGHRACAVPLADLAISMAGCPRVPDGADPPANAIVPIAQQSR